MDRTADVSVYERCLVQAAEGCRLAVRVVPRSGRTAVAGIRGGAVLVRLAAAPVDGAANDALIGLIADLVGVPRRAVTLVSGARSRDKRLVIAGVSAARAASRLASAAE